MRNVTESAFSFGIGTAIATLEWLTSASLRIVMSSVGVEHHAGINDEVAVILEDVVAAKQVLSYAGEGRR